MKIKLFLVVTVTTLSSYSQVFVIVILLDSGIPFGNLNLWLSIVNSITRVFTISLFILLFLSTSKEILLNKPLFITSSYNIAGLSIKLIAVIALGSIIGYFGYLGGTFLFHETDIFYYFTNDLFLVGINILTIVVVSILLPLAAILFIFAYHGLLIEKNRN